MPYPLKMDANGQLLPIERQKAFPAHGGNVENFLIEQNSVVDAGAVLATMYDAELESNLRKLRLGTAIGRSTRSELSVARGVREGQGR